MAYCSFCGAKEDKDMPICPACGALRYPITTSRRLKKTSKHDKLKLSAIVAATIVTPGSLVFLAAIGANRLNSKYKKQKKR